MSQEITFERLEHLTTRITDRLPHVSSENDYWMVRADGGEYYNDFLYHNYIGINWNEISLEDIEKCKANTEEIKQLLRDKLDPKNYPNDELSNKQIGTWAGQLSRFYNKMKINDYVLVPSEGSQSFLVGRIKGEAYEETQEQLDDLRAASQYKISNYFKRYPIKWIGKFNRQEADSALYKIIYSHTTLTNINEYRKYINRALFPAYISDDKLHLTFTVNRSEDIKSKSLGEFVYKFSEINQLIHEDNSPDTRINVQSPGIIEMIFEHAPEALISIVVILATSNIIIGGELSIGKFKYTTDGLLKILSDVKNSKLTHDDKKLDNIKKAVELSEELQLPISELDIEIPQSIVDRLDQEFYDSQEELDKSEE